MLRVKSKGKVVLIKDKYFAPFRPDPKVMKYKASALPDPHAAVVEPYRPVLGVSTKLL